MGQRLAELFIDITMRGGAKPQLIALRDQIAAMDKSLENNASLYKRQTAAKLDQLDKIAARQKQLAALDEKTYGSARYQKHANTRAEADFDLQMAQSAKVAAQEKATHAAFLSNFGTRRQQESVLRDIQIDKNKKKREELLLLQRTTLEHGKGAAFAQMLKNQLASGLAAASGVTAAAYAGIQLAKGASPNAAATFEGSWKMLTNEIGQTLIPALTNLSKSLQSAADVVSGFKAAYANAEQTGASWWRSFLDIFGLKPRGDRSTNQGDMYTSSQHQARFTSFEEGWRRVQQDAASGGSLEAKLLQQAIIGNQIAAQIATNTGQPPPRPGNTN